MLGIIRYLPGSGNSPEEDQCHFDGWYQGAEGKEMAERVYKLWCELFQPDWHVVIIEGKTARLGLPQRNPNLNPRPLMKPRTSVR